MILKARDRAGKRHDQSHGHMHVLASHHDLLVCPAVVQDIGIVTPRLYAFVATPFVVATDEVDDDVVFNTFFGRSNFECLLERGRRVVVCQNLSACTQ